MDPDELDALSAWLARRGIALALTPSSPPAPPATAAVLRLPDGRQLQFADAAPLPAADYRQLAEHAGDLLLAVDPDLVLRYASPATEAMLGWASGELAGRTLAELLVVALWTRLFPALAARDRLVPPAAPADR